MTDRWGWLDENFGVSQGMVALDEDDEMDDEEWEDEDDWDDEDDEWDDEDEDEEEWDEWYDDDEALLDPDLSPADWN